MPEWSEQAQLQQRPVKDNLAPEERAALRSLRQHADIVIKPADKRGAVLVWDQDLYQQEAERQLSDTTFYKKTGPRLHHALQQNNLLSG